MARHAAGEVQSELYLALDCTYITQDEFQSAYTMTLDVKRLINRLITYLRKD